MSIDRSYDISEVADLAGVSSRTLRHYDAIGLVRPRATGPGGRRSYGRAEILRLQRILILRAMGLPLDRIAKVLDEDIDEVAALRVHRVELAAQAERLDSLIDTVDRTIAHLEGGSAMEPEDVFDGIAGYDAAQQREYQAEAAELWGTDVVDASRRRAGALTREQAAAVMAEHESIAREAARLHLERAAADGDEAQAVVARHFAWVCTFWTPDAQSYAGLGRMYVDDDRFRQNYDRFGEGTAQFMCEAMEVYAAAVLE